MNKESRPTSLSTLVERRMELFPLTARIDRRAQGNCLTIAGCDLVELAEQYGTPLYLYDQTTMDASVAAYRQALATHYPGESGITFAGKAFLCIALAQWSVRQSLWLDCTGAGELYVAAAAGVPRSNILVHGVNKSAADLDAAVAQAGVIVVDNLPELERLAHRHAQMAGGSHFPDLWLRIRPGLAVDTHAYRQTGQSDSKFGLEPDEAEEAVALCLARGMPLAGLHFHQGSHFHDPTPIGPALAMVLEVAARLYRDQGWRPRALCPGGGWGIAYHEDDLPHPPIERYVAYVAQQVITHCQRLGLPLPCLQLEPGRSLVAQAGVALYRVGAVKQSAQRRWVLIDGGMADNPRPALYGARYSALPVCEPQREFTSPAWLAGPYCESGDVIIEGLPLPEMAAGELLAVPASGAYHLPMGSNYNGARKPAVLWLVRNADGQGNAHLIQRRETLDDLISRDLPLPFDGS